MPHALSTVLPGLELQMLPLCFRRGGCEIRCAQAKVFGGKYLVDERRNYKWATFLLLRENSPRGTRGKKSLVHSYKHHLTTFYSFMLHLITKPWFTDMFYSAQKLGWWTQWTCFAPGAEPLYNTLQQWMRASSFHEVYWMKRQKGKQQQYLAWLGV